MTNLFIVGVNGVQGYSLRLEHPQPPPPTPKKNKNKKGYALAFFFGVFL